MNIPKIKVCERMCCEQSVIFFLQILHICPILSRQNLPNLYIHFNKNEAKANYLTEVPNIRLPFNVSSTYFKVKMN